MFYYATALLVAFSAVNAHMLLSTPPRFPSETLNSPLNDFDDGTPDTTSSLNYPCQNQIYDPNAPRTKIPIGSAYTLTFDGESVHGGGSCQISLTTDLAPSQSSDFRVIHSIVGGCPAWNQVGNLLDDSSSTLPDNYTYDFTIPQAVNPGQYTLAWSWFNRVGNREMYMQCAPIEVTSGSTSGKRFAEPLSKRDDTAFQALPAMFLANIPGVPCTTLDAESKDLIFPDPGASVQRYDFFPSSPPNGDVSQCYAPLGSTNLASSTTGNSSSSNPPDSSAGGTAPSFIASSAAAAPTQFIASSAAAAPAPYVTSAASPPYPTGESPTAPASTGSSSTSSGSCPSGQTPCTAFVVCIGSDQFGLCNNGCAVAQDLAAGTVCDGGVITKRAYQPRGFGWYGYRLW